MRYWLEVPYAEKDDAKRLGARWDPQERRWFSTSQPTGGLAHWYVADLPQLLPGEDRGFGGGLFVDLVPSSCWFTNVRSCVSKQDWERIRRMMRSRADAVCEACGNAEDRAAERWLEAHERWEYDDASRTQSLRRLILLCTDCHTATHFGFASLKGRDGQARSTLRRVNGWTEGEVEKHLAEAFALWERRNRHDWTLDLSMLKGAGITIEAPPAAAERRGVAAQRLGADRTAAPQHRSGETPAARSITPAAPSAGRGRPAPETGLGRAPAPARTSRKSGLLEKLRRLFGG